MTLTPLHQHILRLFDLYDQFTDEELAIAYRHHRIQSHGLWSEVAESTLRIRRSELVKEGRVRDSGKRGPTARNKTAIIWELVE